MNLTQKKKIIHYLENKTYSPFDKIYTLDELSEIKTELPHQWLQLCSDPIKNIELLWNNATHLLPEFVSTLKKSIIDIFIGVDHLGMNMIYYLDNWTEFDVNVYTKGFMIGGIPIDKTKIDNIETTIGKLPESLKYIWQTHAYLLLRSKSVLASLAPNAFKRFGSIKNIGQRVAINQENKVYDCLAIIDSREELPWCLTKQENENQWNDDLKMAQRDGTKIICYGDSNLDYLLLSPA